MVHNRYREALFILGLILTLGCARTQSQVIVITATFQPPPATPMMDGVVAQPVTVAAPTLDSIQPNQSQLSEFEAYTVQPGDTLSGIAAANGVTVDALVEINNLSDANLLAVGQTLRLPAPPDTYTPAVKVIANGRVVRGPGASEFNVDAFINVQPGYINNMAEPVEQRLSNGSIIKNTLTASQIVQQVALEYSIDARLLLALLEYRSGWLTNAVPSPEARLYPMGQVDPNREGLYKQLAWSANQLNFGYYGWRYGNLRIVQFNGGERLLYAPGLNAGTVAVQYFLSLNNRYDLWTQQIQPDGFQTLYRQLFGDPFEAVADPLVPERMQQPNLQLPFAQGEVWFYTGGPHGGWGNGSAWAAVDFAPPDNRQPGDPACYTSEFAVRAVAEGVVARSERGSVILDLDSDGLEETGWTILYLHLDSLTATPETAVVAAGDFIGYPSCEGGVSTATHLHIARRYNGEWIPATCHDCPYDGYVPNFNLSGWEIIGFEGQLYQGIMRNAGEERRAEQGRLNPINRVSW